jgi:predicted ATP-dependent endonuclease of OLD family
MVFNRVIIDSYKCFRHLDMKISDALTLVVGDNETGKSTLLEAVNLCLTQQLYGHNISYELSPYLFNKQIVSEYLDGLQEGRKTNPPSIVIELFFEDCKVFSALKGQNNSQRLNVPGLRLSIEFNPEYSDEYQRYIEEPDKIRTIPTEYYHVTWYSFAWGAVTKRSIGTNVTFIDTTAIRLQYGSDYYMQKIIDDSLEPREKAEIAIAYRMLKENFAEQGAFRKINKQLSLQKGRISDKELQISIDVSQKAGWESSLTSYLDNIPFEHIGRGDQSILKVLIALDRKADESHVILIEEPENHLSYSTLNYLIGKIQEKCGSKQVLIATHSTYVLNKLGIDKVMLMGTGHEAASLRGLNHDTQDYFRKLPGYDTLRLMIAKYPILVEGPSDELIVQKAYLQSRGKLPIHDGIDVISVGSLAFKRFLEIAGLLNKFVVVVTDNDGDYETKVEKKYADYIHEKNVRFCYDKNDSRRTLESQIAGVNTLDDMNQMLSQSFSGEPALLDWMDNNKTMCALRLFDYDGHINVPDYIMRAFDGQ